MSDTLSVPFWVWAATVGVIVALVAVDIRSARRPHVVGFREAAIWSSVYIAFAVGFGVVLTVTAGSGPGLEYFAGYLIEKSLSVDNLFVFAILLTTFAVPARHQQKVLLIGIVGALVLRAAFIAVGAVAIERFAITFLFFGAFLIYTALQLVRSYGETKVGDPLAVRLVRRVVPVAESETDGALLTRVKGRRAVTPLGVAVLAILSVDIVFALDSIPAVFGVTESPYIVFTANAFALLGLRALYFLIVGLLDRLVHLHIGLALVLGFIGVKLILHYLHKVSPDVPEISTGLSLGVVAAVLAVTTVTSLRSSSKRDRLAAAAPGTSDGSVQDHLQP